MYFNTFYVGDLIPNKAGEIHLEPVYSSVVYNEYVMDFESLNEEFLSLRRFLELWEILFPHVKVRKYKAVSGKCNTCADLSKARANSGDGPRRQIITELHALHRTTYMGERLEYYNRKLLAMKFPDDYMSVITGICCYGVSLFAF